MTDLQPKVPLTVTTRGIITCLEGNPYKPLFTMAMLFNLQAKTPSKHSKNDRKCTPPAGNEVTPARTGVVIYSQYRWSVRIIRWYCWCFRNPGHHVAVPPNVWIVNSMSWLKNGWIKGRVTCVTTFGTQQNSVVSERVARKGFNMEMVKVQRRSCLFEQRYVALQIEGKIKISCFFRTTRTLLELHLFIICTVY